MSAILIIPLLDCSFIYCARSIYFVVKYIQFIILVAYDYLVVTVHFFTVSDYVGRD